MNRKKLIAVGIVLLVISVGIRLALEIRKNIILHTTNVLETISEKNDVRLVFKTEDNSISQQQMLDVQTILRKRLDFKGLGSANVIINSANSSICIELPNGKNTEELRVFLGKTGNLQFVESMSTQTEVFNGKEVYTEPISMPDFTKIVMGSKDIVSASARWAGEDTLNQNSYFIELTLSNEAVTKFADVTEKNIGKVIYIFLDDELLATPMVSERIETRNPIITGNYSEEEAKELAKLISIGKLPCAIRLEKIEEI